LGRQVFFMLTKAIPGLYLLLLSPLLGPYSTVYAAQLTHEQAELLKAPTELNIGGVKLSFESEAYLDLMLQMIDSSDRKIDCAMEGRLIVPIRIHVSVLPKDTTIENVWIHSDGKWWSGKFNAAETGKGKDHLRMITRGCPTQIFRRGAFADVIVEVRDKRTTRYLRAPAKRLGAAH
jgi:hypothetical protein